MRPGDGSAASEITDIHTGHARAARWPLWVALVLSLLSPLLAISSYFPAQDGPNHLYTFHTLRELGRAGSWAHHFFVARLAGHITYILAERLVLVLAHLVPLAVADRVMVMLLLAVLPLSILYFLRRMNPEGAVYLLVAPMLALNWQVHMGFWNQLYGYAAAFAVLGWALPRLVSPSRRDLLWLALLCELLVAIHPIALAAGLVALVVTAAIVPAAGERLRRVTEVSVAAVPALLLFVVAGIGSMDGREMVPIGLPPPPIVWETIPRRICFFFAQVGFSVRFWIVPLLVALFAMLVFGGLWVLWKRNVSLDEGRVTLRFSRRDAPLAVAAVFYVAYLVAPFAIAQQLSFIAQRLPLLIVVFAVAWLPPPCTALRARRIGLVLSAAAALLMVENFSYIRQWNRVLREYTAGETHIEPGSKILPAFFDTLGDVPAVAYPIVQAWGYYGVARDAVAPYSFAYQPHIAIGFKPREHAQELPNPGEFYAEVLTKNGLPGDEDRPEYTRAEGRDLGYRRLLEYGRAYDYMVLWRAPERFLELARTAGFAETFARGRLTILRPPGKGVPRPRPDTEPTPAIPWDI